MLKESVFIPALNYTEQEVNSILSSSSKTTVKVSLILWCLTAGWPLLLPAWLFNTWLLLFDLTPKRWSYRSLSGDGAWHSRIVTFGSRLFHLFRMRRRLKRSQNIRPVCLQTCKDLLGSYLYSSEPVTAIETSLSTVYNDDPHSQNHVFL